MRIDSPQKGPVTFHLETSSGTRALQAVGMGEVDFITYREDLTGSVACGALPAPVPVDVTVKAVATAQSAVVVAIECLPQS